MASGPTRRDRAQELFRLRRGRVGNQAGQAQRGYPPRLAHRLFNVSFFQALTHLIGFFLKAAGNEQHESCPLLFVESVACWLSVNDGGESHAL